MKHWMVVSVANRDVWFQLDSRIFQKFEVMHIAKALKISVNETIGAMVRLWSLSLTDFPEGKGKLSSGDFGVHIEHLPTVMSLENSAEDIYKALESCSWIDQEDGIVVIPEWDKKIGQTILKLERDKKRKLHSSRGNGTQGSGS